jgi:hypothetical protein
MGSCEPRGDAGDPGAPELGRASETTYHPNSPRTSHLPLTGVPSLQELDAGVPSRPAAAQGFHSARMSRALVLNPQSLPPPFMTPR